MKIQLPASGIRAHAQADFQLFLSCGGCRICRGFKFIQSLIWSKYIFIGRRRAYLPHVFPQITWCSSCCHLVMSPKIGIAAFLWLLKEICCDWLRLGLVYLFSWPCKKSFAFSGNTISQQLPNSDLVMQLVYRIHGYISELAKRYISGLLCEHSQISFYFLK